MHSRKDPTEIGTDEYGNSVLNYYECTKGQCSEIYDLTCERRCNERTFKTGQGINSVLFIQEHVIMAQCAKRSTVNVSSLDEGKSSRSNTLMVACTNVTFDVEARSMISQDCVNGTWFQDNFNGGRTNYSHLTQLENSFLSHNDQLVTLNLLHNLEPTGLSETTRTGG